MEHVDVLGDRDLTHGFVELRQLDVTGAPVGVVELLARHAELGAQLDEREDATLRPTPSAGLATSPTRPRSVAE